MTNENKTLIQIPNARMVAGVGIQWDRTRYTVRFLDQNYDIIPMKGGETEISVHFKNHGDFLDLIGEICAQHKMKVRPLEPQKYHPVYFFWDDTEKVASDVERSPQEEEIQSAVAV